MEFAIILPLLALLLVMAIDVGRVFFGWVALQNAVRIGADLAAQSADAWPPGPGDPAEEVLDRNRYQDLITQDLEAANCTFPTPHPDPSFADLDGNLRIDYGDTATVELTCTFGLLTPLAEGLFGGPIQLVAASTFSVNGVVVRGVPDPPAPAEPCATVDASFETTPAASGGRVTDAAGDGVGSEANPFLVDFSANAEDTQYCTYTYEWAVEGTPFATTKDVIDQPFTDPAGGSPTDYTVTLTVTNSEGDSDSDDITVRVRNP